MALLDGPAPCTCRSHSWAVCGSAAGALQNVSREVASRMVVRELDTVCPLAELLAAPDLQVGAVP